MNIAVFCSGDGSNFQAIIDSEKKGLFNAKVSLMICDNPDAYAIKRAEKEGITCIVVNMKEFASKAAFEKKIIDSLSVKDIGLICLAGYMRLLSPGFVERYAGKIINVHPALLPAFKGSNAVVDAFKYGVKISGVTLHFVTQEVDEGPIILQEAVVIKDSDTLKSLEEKIHKVEHKLYPKAIKLFVDKKLQISVRRVEIKK
jgi:phosphoribosylglycinamide formyltransferase 1